MFIFYKGGGQIRPGPCRFYKPRGPHHTALQNQGQRAMIIITAIRKHD